MNDLKEMLLKPNDVSQKLMTRGYTLDIKFIEENSALRKIPIQKEDLVSEKNRLSDSFKSVSTDSEKANQ